MKYFTDPKFIWKQIAVELFNIGVHAKRYSVDSDSGVIILNEKPEPYPVYTEQTIEVRLRTAKVLIYVPSEEMAEANANIREILNRLVDATDLSEQLRPIKDSVVRIKMMTAPVDFSIYSLASLHRIPKFPQHPRWVEHVISIIYDPHCNLKVANEHPPLSFGWDQFRLLASKSDVLLNGKPVRLSHLTFGYSEIACRRRIIPAGCKRLRDRIHPSITFGKPLLNREPIVCHHCKENCFEYVFFFGVAYELPHCYECVYDPAILRRFCRGAKIRQVGCLPSADHVLCEIGISGLIGSILSRSFRRSVAMNIEGRELMLIDPHGPEPHYLGIVGAVENYIEIELHPAFRDALILLIGITAETMPDFLRGVVVFSCEFL